MQSLIRVSITAGAPRNARTLAEVESCDLGRSGSTSANKIGAVQAVIALVVMEERHATWDKETGSQLRPLHLPEGRSPLIPQVPGPSGPCCHTGAGGSCEEP
ncbi:hypothetical protein AB0F20_24905 [Streptomyces goshikiensis]|uniref:hypothetical protein n=1 Tax=Streptomyces goshikiensis TaxID=1942 RepID=UPI003400305C